MKLTIEDFREYICSELRKKLGNNYEVENENAIKLNSIGCMGIRIQKSHTNICPVIYMEGIYEQYESNEITLEEAAICAHMMYQNAKSEAEVKAEITWMEDWETAKEFLKTKLINTERNEKLLPQVPHKDICNLSIIFYLALETKEGISAGVTINHELMNLYGQNVDSLYEQAINNISEDDVRFMGLHDMVKKADSKSFDYNEEEVAQVEMYVLTNKQNMFGASVILSPCAQNLIQETIKRSVYVLPCSVHETILIPYKSDMNPEDLCNMVKEVNAAMICPMEYLADNVYLLKNGKLELVV